MLRVGVVEHLLCVCVGGCGCVDGGTCLNSILKSANKINVKILCLN